MIMRQTEGWLDNLKTIMLKVSVSSWRGKDEADRVAVPKLEKNFVHHPVVT